MPKILIRIVRKACDPDKTKRFQTAFEFRQQLDRLRFAIDWIVVDQLEWQGFQNNDVYRLKVDQKTFKLSFWKNGRRNLSLCCDFPVLSEAISAAHNRIAISSLS